MIIRVDNREKDLFMNMQKIIGDNILEIKQLDLGDIIIYDNEENEKLIIERKTWNDLAASIKDGRYAEQSYRLDNCELHNHNIIYLLEGKLNHFGANKFNSSITKKTLISTIASLSYYKGFSILQSEDIESTSELIIQICNKINKNKEKSSYYEGCNDASVKKNYCDVLKRVKKANITEDNIGAIMISQIPGISTATAQVIMEKFKTIKNMIEMYSKDTECLDDIMLKTKAGEKKLNKTVINNLKKYILQ